jgi:elongation factor Tu
MLAARMSDAAPRRPTLTVATVGHHRHGKTTLTAAISTVLSRRPGAEAGAVDPAALDRRGGSPPRTLDGGRLRDMSGQEHLTVAAGRVRYATGRREFFHLDSPGRRPWLKNAARAQGVADALVLVVSAPDGVQPQTHEHLLLARALGVDQLVVFLGKCDLVEDTEWVDLVERDVRDLLDRCGFDGDATRIVRGAAGPALAGDPRWEPGVRDLVDALEHDLAVPPRPQGGPPLLYVHQSYAIPAARPGVVVDGRLLRGALRRGDPVQLVGPGAAAGLVVRDLEVARARVEQAEPGDFVGVLLARPDAALHRRELLSGAALTAPAARPVTRLGVRLELHPAEHVGRPTPVWTGHVASLLFGTLVMTGRLRLREGLYPGGAAEAQVELFAPAYVEPGARFALRDGNQGPAVARRPAAWGGLAGRGQVLAVDPDPWP